MTRETRQSAPGLVAAHDALMRDPGRRSPPPSPASPAAALGAARGRARGVHDRRGRPRAAGASRPERDPRRRDRGRHPRAVRPGWRVAGLEGADIGIYLVHDNQLNSFVASGQAIFFNTGLILRAENANQLLGVIAHETGHITGGHSFAPARGGA